jgi:hypothetical protein
MSLNWGSMKKQRRERIDIELLTLLRPRPSAERRLTLVRTAANALIGSALVWGVLYWIVTR